VTTENGPNAPCRRTACAEYGAHRGGLHLDPASALWDGPEITIGALGHQQRDAAWTLRRLATVDNRHEVDVAVYTFAREIHRLREAIGHLRVDRDRSVRAASERALDCVEHGKIIVDLEAQVHKCDTARRHTEDARRVLLGLLHQITSTVTAMRTRTKLGEPLPSGAEFVDVLDKAARKTSSAHARMWKK